jgi:hypothetical protein
MDSMTWDWVMLLYWFIAASIIIGTPVLFVIWIYLMLGGRQKRARINTETQ